MKVAALFVADEGPYINRAAIDPWPESRDARTYTGPYPVIAHPPCERYGRYWGGGPSAKVKRELGDDGGCFASALRAVQVWGGVLEHPAHSYAWDIYRIPFPTPGCWEQVGKVAKGFEWVCHVEQGHYGHPARKATWLYAVSPVKPPDLKWGPSEGIRLDEGFHSKEERRLARLSGKKPVKRLSKKQCEHTPEAFAQVLFQIACSTQQVGDADG